MPCIYCANLLTYLYVKNILRAGTPLTPCVCRAILCCSCIGFQSIASTSSVFIARRIFLAHTSSVSCHQIITWLYAAIVNYVSENTFSVMNLMLVDHVQILYLHTFFLQINVQITLNAKTLGYFVTNSLFGTKFYYSLLKFLPKISTPLQFLHLPNHSSEYSRTANLIKQVLNINQP